MSAAVMIDDHLDLLAGETADGRPVLESVPAAHVQGNHFRLRATPGLVEGCAAGDVVAVREDGRFRVVQRGGNLGIHVDAPAPLAEAEVSVLRSGIEPLEGSVDAPWHRRFLVVTVPAGAGLDAVGRAMEHWCGGAGAGWCYTNVYDEEGEPLGWWEDDPR